MDKEKKKKIAVIAVCFIGAFVFIITSFLSFNYGRKDNKQPSTEESTESESYDFKESTDTSSIGVQLSTEEIQELMDNADTEPLDQTETVDTTYNNDFNVTGLKDELLPFINNDLKGMSDNIQETLYANGYYDYTSVRFQDQVELDYDSASITLYFMAYCNEDVNISVTYYREKNTWYTQIW